MNLRKHLIEATTLIAAAVICALIANAAASRERKLVLVGTYPNAQTVPQHRDEEPVAVPSTQAGLSQTDVTPSIASTASSSKPTDSAESSAVTSSIPQPSPIKPSTPATETAKGQSTTAHRIDTSAMAPAAPARATAAPATAADPSRYAPHPDKAYVEIGYGDVATLHAAKALFLDARRTSVYEQGHIPGARTFSVWESDIDQKVNSLFSERSDPQQQVLPIVVYCSGGDCEDSHMLAQKLWGIQFNNVYVYKDGFPDWQARGGVVHTGTNP